ncbi:ShlB/FhaC/HecB family hemolysin secretion/activation protein [Limnohabitans sp. WS1]|uniref:ShlB/FhaC/HecB family hemolysin secretion/activation protein n=1 Tax=Limnohabitans sp. WS1 TaxID=1100726 RepID=UPI001E556F30|nr:ShlB/FhaC/HecB family hemolysin secretion/activation protein [Limnohabitans sp. WS1]
MAQTLPSAGGLLQQMPLLPAAPQRAPQLDLPTPKPVTGLLPPAMVFVAQRLNVTGASAYTEAELVKVAGFEPGQALSLRALGEMADKITRHYRQQGYGVAQAYLPAQEVQNGAVTITVLEGQYGQITLNNSSDLDDQLPRSLLADLNYGDVIMAQPLEERLLLLSDVPGVQVRSTLMPGASRGLSDLVLELKPGPLLSGSLDADNAGNRYTGEYRAGATVHLNNPSGRGDLLTLRGLSSGEGLNYLRAAYQAPLGRARLGLAYSDLSYQLGHEFEPLQAQGHARITTLFASYPLRRSRQSNMNVGLSWDHKVFQDRLEAMALVTDKQAQVATVSLYGDQRDGLGAGGLNTYSLAWSTGHVDIQTPAARALDASTADTNGHFNKLSFAVSRMQQVRQGLTLWTSLSGQMASQNLDVSEKMALGGMYGVRAYPEGEAAADEGYLLTLEVRQQLLGLAPASGQVHLAAFVDAGVVKLNHNPWTSTPTHRHLSGAGVGVYWTQTRDFSVKAFYARKLGNADAVSAPDRSGRFWIQGVKYF